MIQMLRCLIKQNISSLILFEGSAIIPKFNRYLLKPLKRRYLNGQREGFDVW